MIRVAQPLLAVGPPPECGCLRRAGQVNFWLRTTSTVAA